MKNQDKILLKKKIDNAQLVSFDIFDTLLFRKTNSPEAIFELVGKHFNIHGFKKLRKDAQDEASVRAWHSHQAPHADIDEIYCVLEEHTHIPVVWEEVKKYEIQMEKDALVANTELLEIFLYAKEQGKRVIAISDMYLFANTLSEVLSENGYGDIDHVYCSADEHKAKFNKKLFEFVAEKENISYENILHIGDNERDDGQHPASFGMDIFVYHSDADMPKIKDSISSEVDKGLYKILYDKEKGFWYNLGVEVGGPIYMGLYRYMLEELKGKGDKVYFLSRDGYNLYNVFKKFGYDNIEYIYTSRRALLLASITEMNEEEIKTLPPYTYGQTVNEILDFLCIDKNKISHLNEAGFAAFDDVITDENARNRLRKLYSLDRDVFLERCRTERENALAYFNKIGFFDENSVCFDCGWQGSSQDLLERFKKAVNKNAKQHFIYFGIKNTEKSRNQLKGRHYSAYRFDFYKNYFLQYDAVSNIALYELFFSAPHESVFIYGENGNIIFETDDGDIRNSELLSGICSFVEEGADFVEKYDVEYTPEIALGHLKRLIHFPTEEEAVTIGNLSKVDGFSKKAGEDKRIAFIDENQIKNIIPGEIYWLKGLLKRADVSEEVKKEASLKLGYIYPEIPFQYHLEDFRSIGNYRRWLRNNKTRESSCVADLNYKPQFSVVIPVYNTATEQLEECIQSVLAQIYENYELILVDDNSSWGNVVPVLQKYEADSRVKVIYRPTNGHISAATNDGINIASGDFIVFMDCDDTIEPDALYEFAKKLNENPELDFIYSDEDKITEDGKVNHAPFFKPDWSPDLFMNMMYTNHLAAYRGTIVKAVGGLRSEYNGSQDHDFTLRFMEKSHNTRVGHISKILYHWRERKESASYAVSAKDYASEATRLAKEDFIRRNNIKAHLEYITGMSQYRIVYEVVNNPLVSIIIPSKDNPFVLMNCINSLKEFTRYSNYEIIVVDNGSNEENKQIIEQYLLSVGGRYIYEKEDFNFSKMCNTGASFAAGEYLLFLNDDIEIFQKEWLEKLLGQAQQKHTGAVGAKLFYPQSTLIQHAGIANLSTEPVHNFIGYDDQYPYYFGFNWVDYNCIAVTGACLMVAAEKFRLVGGFDEKYPVTYNDVKLCFDLYDAGYYNVVRNDAVAYHYESLSRGHDYLDEQKLIKLHSEKIKLYKEFAHLKGRDPFTNQNIGSYQTVLNLKDSTEKVREIDLPKSVAPLSGEIDSIIVNKNIEINGWSIIDCQDYDEEYERYVVFKDPFGKTYGAKAEFYSRPDVAKVFDIHNDLYLGFECVIAQKDLHMDIIPYQVGILVIDKNGEKYLKWCKESPVERNFKPVPALPQIEKINDFALHNTNNDIRWAIDEFNHYDTHFKIRGYVFKHGADHYKYTKSIVLTNDNASYEIELQPEERLDVACAFPQEHFLYYTGFVCYLFDGSLYTDTKQEYGLVLRLRNQFDSNDVHDIPTGKRIFL